MRPDRDAITRLNKQRAYYKKHDLNKEKQRLRMRGIKEGLVELLGGRCMDCGFTGDPICFHFDHRNPWEKSSSIQRLCSRRKKDLLWEEIQKCDLVCANCHALRTSRNPDVAAKQVFGRTKNRKTDGDLVCEFEGTMGAAILRVLDQFADELQASKRKNSTVYIYLVRVKGFAKWCSSKNISHMCDIDAAVELYRRGASASVAAQARAALGLFVVFWRKLDGVNKD